MEDCHSGIDLKHPHKNRISGFIKLTRAEHSVMLAFAVIAAEIILGFKITLPLFVLALLPPILVSMGAFAINDYFDVEVDRKNGFLNRPLVDHTFTKAEAVCVYLVTTVLGIIASALINPYVFIITLIFAGAAYFYSYKLKEVVIIGNAYIAFSMAIPFIYGNYIITSILNPNILLISIIVFLSGFGREIHGMVRDAEGDKGVRKIRNIVHYFGEKGANLISAALYTVSIFLSLFMFFFMLPFKGNALYLIPMAIVDIVLVYNMRIYFTKNAKKRYGLSRNLSLAAMAAATLIFIASSIFYLSL